MMSDKSRSANHTILWKLTQSMGLIMAFYVASIVSFYFPHVVDVNVLSICSVLCAFVVVLSRCFLYLSFVLSVNYSIWGFIFMVNMV